MDFSDRLEHGYNQIIHFSLLQYNLWQTEFISIHFYEDTGRRIFPLTRATMAGWPVDVTECLTRRGRGTPVAQATLLPIVRSVRVKIWQIVYKA